MQKEIRIKTGEVKKIKNGLFNSVRLIYSGMPNESTFSITAMIDEGYTGYSPVIYYPVNSEFIHIEKFRFRVKEVTPTRIHLLLV